MEESARDEESVRSRTSLFLARSICLQEPVNYVHRFLRRDTLCLQGENWRRSLPHYNQVNTAKTMIELAIQQLKERNIRFNRETVTVTPIRGRRHRVSFLSQGEPRKMVLRFSPPTE